MKKFAVFYLSLLLIFLQQWSEVRQLEKFIRYQHSKCASQKDQSNSLTDAFTKGEKKCLSKKKKEAYQIMGLFHLFTPSGLHLTSLLTPFKYLISSNKLTILCIFIWLSTFFIGGFACIRRLSLLKAISSKPSQLILISVMMTDLILFQNQQYLGWCYSFLFLGIIYSKIAHFEKIILLFVANIVIAYIHQNDVSLLSPFVNLIFIPIFSFIFPLFILNEIIPISIINNISTYVVSVFDSMIIYLSRIEILYITPKIETVFFILLLTHLEKKFIPIIILIFPINVDRGELQKYKFTSKYEKTIETKKPSFLK